MDIILLCLLLLAGWFWLDCIAKRDIAVLAGRSIASKFQLQLLDETVACVKTSLARDARGHAQILRQYVFEVSPDGVSRMPCELHLLGKQPHFWHIPPYIAADNVIENPPQTPSALH